MSRDVHAESCASADMYGDKEAGESDDDRAGDDCSVDAATRVCEDSTGSRIEYSAERTVLGTCQQGPCSIMHGLETREASPARRPSKDRTKCYISGIRIAPSLT